MLTKKKKRRSPQVLVTLFSFAIYCQQCQTDNRFTVVWKTATRPCPCTLDGTATIYGENCQMTEQPWFTRRMPRWHDIPFPDLRRTPKIRHQPGFFFFAEWSSEKIRSLSGFFTSRYKAFSEELTNLYQVFTSQNMLTIPKVHKRT